MSQRTVLLLEDEALIAMDMAMELEAIGLDVIQTNTIREALAAIQVHDLDAAILDLDIQGEPTTNVAAALRDRRIPFVVCSGSQLAEFSEIFGNVPTIPKPFRSDELSGTVLSILQRAS
jgi:DNA-binding NtrC family response regulator